ncbi:MAG: hypothetical protein JNG82_08475 [Opitutaceae bacterium]|nr:hypothetical protein [Opitutaceae bacterium]
MKTGFLAILFFPAVLAAAAPGPNGWRFEELNRLAAPEARQGVAAGRDFLFAINNHEIGQYRKTGGERVAGWSCPEGEPLIHLNAGIVHEGRLYCAHSNYPAVPMQSSVEAWDTATLKHAGSRSLGRTDGSLTWIDRRNGRWIACFVHYGKKGGEPGRGPEWTRLVEYDDDWRETGGWTFPADLVAQVGARGYSISGGAIGPGGYLYVTGHDEPELYVLEFPTAGPALAWKATIPVPIEGQAFGWDPQEPGVIYLVARKTRQIIAGRIGLPQ